MNIILKDKSNMTLCRKVTIRKKSSLILPSMLNLNELPLMIVVTPSQSSPYKKGQVLLCSKNVAPEIITIENKRHYVIFDPYVYGHISLEQDEEIVYEEELMSPKKPEVKKTF